MFRSNGVRIAATVFAILILLGVLRYRTLNKPLSRDTAATNPAVSGGTGSSHETLEVAFLPVTCHLTCPVTDYASRTTTTGTVFDAERFAEFPSIVEALKAKKLLAGFLTVPLAMRMREQGAPIRICCLGHRDGSQLVVRKDIPGQDLRSMRGRTIAIPNPFSNENFFLTQMMRNQGMQPSDFHIVTITPPDMVSALASKTIDGFIVAEPFCSKAELNGSGRVLYYAKDIWPNYISCCLVVHEDLIRDKPEIVRDLVRGIVDSGEWAQTNRKSAAKLAAAYFRQDEKLLDYVLTQPGDRVTYRNLNPTDAEMQRIMDMGRDLGFLKKKTPLSELMDRSFFPAQIEAPKIDLAQMSTIVKADAGALSPAKTK